ncbi:unnamed protein product [Brachionus calyciflorus]|uniref:Phage tail collar domain-containing protein n=1 Tax=Brachionus calyciflorus TaxID=104777 RepID=A0A814K0B2_9BILA|nr:unnamed protein product [Brachionus calyciflorus]
MSVLRLSKQDLIKYLKEILYSDGDIQLTFSNDNKILITTSAASLSFVNTSLNVTKNELLLEIGNLEQTLSTNLSNLDIDLNKKITDTDTKFQNIVDEIFDYLQLKTSNIDNTSDLNKPISTATQSALDTKQNNLVNQTYIKSLNNQSLLSNGNLVIDKVFVGLTNVDNTSDLNKPISTATQNALNLKQNLLAEIGLSVPIGTILAYGGVNIPATFLLCNGGSYNTTTYPLLLAVLNSANVPDLRFKDYATARPQTEAFGTNASGDHVHNLQKAWNGSSRSEQVYGVTFQANAGNDRSTGPAGNHSHTIVTGGDAETRPRNVCVHFIIKASYE